MHAFGRLLTRGLRRGRSRKSAEPLGVRVFYVLTALRGLDFIRECAVIFRSMLTLLSVLVAAVTSIPSTRTYELAVGLLTAYRKDTQRSILTARTIAEHSRRERTQLFAQQSHALLRTTAQRKQLEDMGFDVTASAADYPELGPEMDIPLTWVRCKSAPRTAIDVSQGHSRERVVWRTRHVLDTVQLLRRMYAESTASVILVLEDDLHCSVMRVTELMK